MASRRRDLRRPNVPGAASAVTLACTGAADATSGPGLPAPAARMAYQLAGGAAAPC
ncbi:hypothetical protein M8C13_23990 [Crossiella sp. SN42]|uniref:hypothetical protein n=1 Tax=Crossiella sp. SN42 TaxID=2944808 RepID=UPI00207CFD36|nr:hypothetical protein [Crossiella sp. SN42]MCO1578819.1 hypothetical protein [Crossiella sp. SN42]